MLARVRAHPGFPDAMAKATRHLVAAYDGNRLLNRLLNDRERSVFALMALYLHITPDSTGAGLTAGRIIALCRETGLCSRGRAKAMLVLMRWAGFVADSRGLPDLADRRQRPLVLTPQFLEMHTARLRHHFESIASIDPVCAAAASRLDDPTFRAALIRSFLARFRRGERLLDNAPALQLFAARDGGTMIAFQLLLSGAPGDTFPPQDWLAIPVAELGRRFHVSRAHVLKLLRDSEAAGLIERASTPPGGVRLLPPLREALCNFFAAVFFTLSNITHEILDAERSAAGPASDPKIFPMPGQPLPWRRP